MFALKLMGSMLSGVGNLGWSVLSNLPRAAIGTARAAMWPIRHPYLTLGAAAGAAGIYSVAGEGPYTSPTLSNQNININLNIEAAAMQSVNQGLAPMSTMVGRTMSDFMAQRNKQLMESTMGLTQGLHQSRH